MLMPRAVAAPCRAAGKCMRQGIACREEIIVYLYGAGAGRAVQAAVSTGPDLQPLPAGRSVQRKTGNRPSSYCFFSAGSWVSFRFMLSPLFKKHPLWLCMPCHQWITTSDRRSPAACSTYVPAGKSAVLRLQRPPSHRPPATGWPVAE